MAVGIYYWPYIFPHQRTRMFVCDLMMPFK